MDTSKMRFPLFCGMTAKDFGTWYAWVRIFGYGVHIRFVSKGYQPLFSERHGFERVIKIGRLWVRGLKP